MATSLSHRRIAVYTTAVFVLLAPFACGDDSSDDVTIATFFQELEKCQREGLPADFGPIMAGGRVTYFLPLAATAFLKKSETIQAKLAEMVRAPKNSREYLFALILMKLESCGGDCRVRQYSGIVYEFSIPW